MAKFFWQYFWSKNHALAHSFEIKMQIFSKLDLHAGNKKNVKGQNIAREYCINLEACKSEVMANDQTSNLNNELKFKVTILKKINLVQFEWLAKNKQKFEVISPSLVNIKWWQWNNSFVSLLKLALKANNLVLKIIDTFAIKTKRKILNFLKNCFFLPLIFSAFLKNPH